MVQTTMSGTITLGNAERMKNWVTVHLSKIISNFSASFRMIMAFPFPGAKNYGFVLADAF